MKTDIVNDCMRRVHTVGMYSRTEGTKTNTLPKQPLVDFLIYVIEEYKYLENKTAKETIELFTGYNVFNYITQNYPALHTMGGRAIVDDINLFVERRLVSTAITET